MGLLLRVLREDGRIPWNQVLSQNSWLMVLSASHRMLRLFLWDAAVVPVRRWGCSCEMLGLFLWNTGVVPVRCWGCSCETLGLMDRTQRLSVDGDGDWTLIGPGWTTSNQVFFFLNFTLEKISLNWLCHGQKATILIDHRVEQGLHG